MTLIKLMLAAILVLAPVFIEGAECKVVVGANKGKKGTYNAKRASTSVDTGGVKQTDTFKPPASSAWLLTAAVPGLLLLKANSSKLV